MSRTFKEYIETHETLDNRDAERKDVTANYYHSEYDTVTCPHCGCTLGAHHVMTYGYCYVCGGGFANIYPPKEEEESNE